MSNLIIKQSNENISIPLLDSEPSKPFLGVKGYGYVSLNSSGSGNGAYIKVLGNKYKLESDVETGYLEFSSDGNFRVIKSTLNCDGTIEYSIDKGETWTTWDGSQLNGTSTQPIYLRGINNTYVQGDSSLYSSGKYVKGNIETLLDYQTVLNGNHPTMASGTFRGLFGGSDFVEAHILLPTLVLPESCYSVMFDGCTSLKVPPKILATTGNSMSCDSMFRGCTSLEVAPKLFFTSFLPSWRPCCSSMFAGCTSLKTVPALPAVTGGQSYVNMFYGCTALEIAPELPATTLEYSCYASMFSGCTSLIKAPDLPATTLTEGCYSRMFENCTSLTIPPKIFATTAIEYGCCEEMFAYCTSLTTLPKLYITTMEQGPLSYMFGGCSNIKVSTTQTAEYQYEYRIPTIGTGTTDYDGIGDGMFIGTGGTFTGNPDVNTTYYTDHEPI